MNIKTAVTISAALSGAVIGGFTALSVVSDRNHQKRMQALEEDIESSRRLGEHLKTTVIPTLDAQLERARFWDIVTRDQ